MNKPINPTLQVNEGDVFRDRDGYATYTVLTKVPLSGRWSVVVENMDSGNQTYGAVDVTDHRMFVRHVLRPVLPTVPRRYVFLQPDGRTTFDDTGDAVAKHDIREGTWRYLDEEVCDGVEREGF
jgi:hypothetical protein